MTDNTNRFPTKLWAQISGKLTEEVSGEQVHVGNRYVWNTGEIEDMIHQQHIGTEYKFIPTNDTG